MIGDMLAKARKDKGMTKTDLAKVTDINIGHLTHIEKGERNPSHKALKVICKALNIPYQPLMFTYDKEITEEQSTYNPINHISYNKVLAVDKIDSFIDCPAKIPSAAIAIKVPDNSMEPTFEKNSYVFVELNTPLSSKDYGIFELNGTIIIRKFMPKKGTIILKADNKSLEEIKVSDEDNFCIIGKIYKNK
ncbi:MAG: LexA family transcriptional regulator [Clostridia bacterium]|jgi:phage repressor protein C with HTH and peptisase S24 domain|nr:LexA family transcriptional regulator [Clostridia bacterium]